MLDVPFDWIRTLDLSTFTGDAWALETSLALPPAAVPRFIASGGPVRWAVSGMDSASVTSTFDTDVVTTFGTRLLKISRAAKTEGLTVAGIPRLLTATSGVNANREFSETDISLGDTFVIAVISLTAGGGSATYLWAYPVAGVSQRAVTGVTP